MLDIFGVLNKYESSRKIFNKIPDINFEINSFCGIAADTAYGGMDRQTGRQAGRQAGRQTEEQASKTKQRDTFHDYTNTPKNRNTKFHRREKTYILISISVLRQ